MLCIMQRSMIIVYLLHFSVDSQNLCGSDSCKKKKKIVVPIVASLLSALVLLIVVIVVWKLRRKRKAGTF